MFWNVNQFCLKSNPLLTDQNDAGTQVNKSTFILHYVISDRAIVSALLWEKKIFMNTNPVGALKSPPGQNLRWLFRF